MLPALLIWQSSWSALAAEASDSAAKLPVCDGQLCSAPLVKGQAAPFDGQILTVPLAINLGQRANACSTVTGIEVTRAVQLAKADLDLEKRVHAIDNDAAKMREAAYKKAAEDLKPKWYESPIFVSLAAVSVTIGLVVATGYAVKTVR